MYGADRAVHCTSARRSGREYWQERRWSTGWKPTGDERFAPLVHEGWTDRIHGAPLRTGPDPVLTCAFEKLPSFSSGVTDTVRARSAPLYGWR